MWFWHYGVTKRGTLQLYVDHFDENLSDYLTEYAQEDQVDVLDNDTGSKFFFDLDSR